ncbi:MAG: hypothetical protein ACI867_002031 [Glaciecola sp.]|jgi:hypothetical protein
MPPKPLAADTPVIGWREWVFLPTLGDIVVKAKVDTGARTSAIHATNVEPFDRNDDQWVRFLVHPDHDDPDVTKSVEARLVDRRHIRSSSGNQEHRYVVHVKASLHGVTFPIELTLTERSDMGFRMLLGRRAVRRRFLIDGSRSYLGGRRPSVG